MYILLQLRPTSRDEVNSPKPHRKSHAGNLSPQGFHGYLRWLLTLLLAYSATNSLTFGLGTKSCSPQQARNCH